MARTLTVNDSYAIINSLARELSGREPNVVATDLSSYVSVGESVLSYGKENALKALSLVLGRTMIAIRPYKAQFNLVQTEDAGTFANRTRKISFMGRDAVPFGWDNTNLNPANLYDGYDNNSHTNPDSVGSMFEQIKPVPYEVNFAGSNGWDSGITRYEDQIDAAFRDPEEMARFAEGYMTRYRNDIEKRKEASNRITVLNYVAGAYSLASQANGSAVNLTEAFNTRFNTSYTTADLQTTHLKEFLAFFVSYVKLLMKNMKIESADYHVNPTVTQDGKTYDYLPRHTSKENIRVMLYSPLFIEAESMILPEIFHDENLKIDTQYEDVLFWQNKEKPASISITPAIPDFTTGEQKAGDAVALDYVVGLIYDKDAMMTQYQLDRAAVSPLEARKGYRTFWNHNRMNFINDFTENHVLLYMADSNRSTSTGKKG